VGFGWANLHAMSKSWVIPFRSRPRGQNGRLCICLARPENGRFCFEDHEHDCYRSAANSKLPTGLMSPFWRETLFRHLVWRPPSKLEERAIAVGLSWPENGCFFEALRHDYRRSKTGLMDQFGRDTLFVTRFDVSVLNLKSERLPWVLAGQKTDVVLNTTAVKAKGTSRVDGPIWERTLLFYHSVYCPHSKLQERAITLGLGWPEDGRCSEHDCCQSKGNLQG